MYLGGKGKRKQQFSPSMIQNNYLDNSIKQKGYTQPGLEMTTYL